MPAVASVGLLLMGAGCSSAGKTTSAAATAGAATTAPTSNPEWKSITYRGVSMSVPGSWPVVDGEHYPGCSFPPDPTVYLGPTYSAPSCAARGPGLAPRQDGVWAQPAPDQPQPDSATTMAVGGQTAYIYPSSPNSPTTSVWFHGLDIQVGLGRDPVWSERILASLSWTPSRPDSPVEGACPTGTRSMAMPAPQTASTSIPLEAGNSVLSPPAPGQHPEAPAAEIWQAYLRLNQPSAPGATAQLLYGLYSAKTPATMNPDGTVTPQYQQVPVWVVYVTPARTPLGDCGPTIIAPFNAANGQSLDLTIEG